MSRFFSEKYKELTPYTPGEQPQDLRYIKLNTNESPFPPCGAVLAACAASAESLRLYPDPDCKALVDALAGVYGVSPGQITVNNGSDETLNFAFMAYCDSGHPAIFPDVTYGFYPVFAALHGIPYREVPLKEDFSVDLEALMASDATVFLANPNAPTGIALCPDEIEALLRSNPDRVVVVDEAYVDFGAESAVPLVHKYENLLVVQTFSKSRSMAGARLGFGIGSAELIRDLNTIKYSTNPYNINRVTAAAGKAALENEPYTRKNCRQIMENRAFTLAELQKLGFVCTDSKANFIFAAHPKADGKYLYLELKQRGVLVRHFDQARIANYNRITVGSREQMEIFLAKLKEILEETL